MRDGRSKHHREEEQEEVAKHGGAPRSGVTFDKAENDVLVSLATITLWKTMWDNAGQERPGAAADDDDGEHLSALLSQLVEEECRRLLDAWNGLLEEAEGARAEREVDELAKRIAWETLLDELQCVYDEYQRQAFTSLVSAWVRDEFNEQEAPLCHGLSEEVDDDDTGGVDRSSLERLWGDELYEEDEEDIEENYMEGEIDSQEQGGDAIDDGEVIRSIRKECSNLTLRIESADEELRRTKSFLAKQLCEADAEREETEAVGRELAEARVHCDKAEREKRKLMEELDEVHAVNDHLGEQLECLGLSEKRNNKRTEQLQRQFQIQSEKLDQTDRERREALDREAASAANRREEAKKTEQWRNTIEGEGDIYPSRPRRLPSPEDEERHLERAAVAGAEEYIECIRELREELQSNQQELERGEEIIEAMAERVRELNAKTAKRIETLKTGDPEEPRPLSPPPSPKAAAKSKTSHLQQQQQQQQNQGRNSYAAVRKVDPLPPLHALQHRRIHQESHPPSSPTLPAHSSTPSSPAVSVDEGAHRSPPNSPLPVITGRVVEDEDVDNADFGPPPHRKGEQALLELGKLNDLVAELTSAEEEERQRRLQLKRNESEELTAAEAESAAKSETAKMSAVEQKSVEGSLKRQNQGTQESNVNGCATVGGTGNERAASASGEVALTVKGTKTRFEAVRNPRAKKETENGLAIVSQVNVAGDGEKRLERVESVSNLQRSLGLQETRTRIAFLENEQAELETEIRLLKGKVEEESNGSGDAEDKICASIVDTVLTRVAAEERADGNRRRRRRAEGELEKRHRRRAVEAERQGASGEGRVSEKMRDGDEGLMCAPDDDDDDVDALQRKLHRSETAACDLRSGLDSERENSLDWMERHNKERNKRRLLEAELDDLRRETMRREEEKSAAVEAAEESRRQKKELREAIRCESENFRKLQSTLAEERARTKSAADRDSETIIELRTSLEVEREQKLALERERKSPGGKNKKKQDLDIVIIDDDTSSPQILSPEMVKNMQVELAEERGRVDRLKRCLEQEREKTEILVVNSKSEGNQPGSDLQQEWIVFNQRRFEGLEIAKEQLNRELKRQRTLNSRMGDEIEHLRGQLRTSGIVATSKSFEHFYVKDLEAKLDAYRTRELQLSEELDRATALIMGLQSENEAALDRERTTRHEAAAESQYAQQQQLNISRLTAANQVLQDRLRVMESRVLELDMQQPKKRKDVALENRLMMSERRRKELVEQKRFLAGRIEHGHDCQMRTVSAISKFRRSALVVLAAVIFQRGRQNPKTFRAQPPSAPPEQPFAINGASKAMPKSPKLAKKAKSESTKEEMSAVIITDL